MNALIRHGFFPLAALHVASAGEFATGDWDGLRPALTERGVIFNFTYVADGFGVVSGGIRRGTLYNGLLDLGTDIDLEKLVGWHGGYFHVNGIFPNGVNGSEKYVGDIGTFSNIQAEDTYRLYELWLEQDFLEGRVSLRAGQITFDSEFAVLDAYGGLFVQSGFGAPQALSANLPIAVYPNATPGIRLRVEPYEGFAIKAAAFDGNPSPGNTPDPSPDAKSSTEFNRHGTHWALRRSEGALLAGEVSYRFNQVPEEESSATGTSADSRASRSRKVTAGRGLAGSYEAGFVYHTDDFSDTRDATLAAIGSSIAPSSPRNRGANHAFYINIEQEIRRETGSEEQGLGFFGHAVWMPPDRNSMDFSIEGGLHYRGPLPGRDDDALGLGIAFLHISDDVASAIDEGNKADGTSDTPPDFESTIELVYRYQFSTWLWIQPHAQYVIQPGGTADIGNALILGIRTNLVF